MQEQRRIFAKKQDWIDFVEQLQNGKGQPQLTGKDLLDLRRACYKDIEAIRKRPLLVYASKFVSVDSPPGIFSSITLEDVDAFTDLVNSVEESVKEVDILIHSPGGAPDATERVVNILRPRFNKVSFLIPHSAYSAATMLALSGNEIVMHRNAVLGPIDPQINGIPARSIKSGFEKIEKLVKENGVEALPPYIPLIEKYTLDLLEQCDDSEKLSQDLAVEWLKMSELVDGGTRKIKTVVKYLASHEKHLIHSRPFTIKKLTENGIKIMQADNGLGSLLWEAYILLDGFFSITPQVKIFENSSDISWGKTFIQAQPVFPIKRPQNFMPLP